jgi:hypothetical protein
MGAEASEPVSIPRAELDALKAELKQLRREAGQGAAIAPFNPTPARAMTQPRSPARTSLRHGEYVSDRLVASQAPPGSRDRGLAAAAAVDSPAHDL